MEKKKLGVIFGGMSTENEVSVVSANSVLKNLDKNKYEIYPIYIEENGNWWTFASQKENMGFGENIQGKERIENITEYLKQLDVVFPVLHGLYGEDGTIQGLFELLKIPYVGCPVLASCVGMDKVYSKVVFNKAGLKQARYEYLRKYKEKYIYIDEAFNEKIVDIREAAIIISEKLRFPMFVKPSNSGSSVGINKAKNLEELQKYIEYAEKFDNKILVEEGIEGREVECAVLGNEEVIASCVGEVKSADEFYSYDAKYKNEKSRTEIPANIPTGISEKIKNQAIKAFKAINGKGLSRVDFFIEKGTNEIYINEINTMPGFTSISMYPKLFKQSGVDYKDLLNKLIDLALENS
ncbi:MAG: D-alanine--D-alanine ligase family protein [Clostridia bacterium]